MKIYSLHNVTDGKWHVKLVIKESDDFKHRYEARPDIRSLVDSNYNVEPEVMAKTILENVMDCEAVEINLMCGPGIYMKRT